MLVVAIYVLFPKIVGADEAVDNLDEANWYWILVAIGFNVLGVRAPTWRCSAACWAGRATTRCTGGSTCARRT